MSALALYLAYVATATALLVGFTAVYIWATPYKELSLIRDGNKAAAFSLGGVEIGFALALSSAAAHSVSLLDMALWGAAALTCQILVFFAATLALPDLRKGVEDGRESYGVALGAFSIAMGLINAGAVSY